MADRVRIDVDQARRDVSAGRALLVCAYDDEAKCRKLALDGSISLREFESRASSLPKDQEIVFYCA